MSSLCLLSVYYSLWGGVGVKCSRTLANHDWPQEFKFHNLCTTGLPFYKDSTSCLTLTPQTYICVVFDMIWLDLWMGVFKVKTLKRPFPSRVLQFSFIKTWEKQKYQVSPFLNNLCQAWVSWAWKEIPWLCWHIHRKLWEKSGKFERYCKYIVLCDCTAHK